MQSPFHFIWGFCPAAHVNSDWVEIVLFGRTEVEHEQRGGQNRRDKPSLVQNKTINTRVSREPSRREDKTESYKHISNQE